MTEFKPSLYDFLVDFKLNRKGRKKNEAKGGKEARNVASVTAARGRKFIRDNKIDNTTLEQIWQDHQGEQHTPFYSLSCLKIKTERLSNGQVITGYHINVADKEKNDVYLDILSSIAKGYLKIQRQSPA
jgi:hypothetical protein